jgi:hypothetical protein
VTGLELSNLSIFTTGNSSNESLFSLLDLEGVFPLELSKLYGIKFTINGDSQVLLIFVSIMSSFATFTLIKINGLNLQYEYSFLLF